MIRIKRVYEPPAESDGQQFLVERLWARSIGISKEDAHLTGWLRAVAPSAALRHGMATNRNAGPSFRSGTSVRIEWWSKKFSRKYHAIVRLLGSVGRHERNGALPSGAGS